MPPKGYVLKPRAQAFEEKVERLADGCWRWTAATNGKGYGVFWRPRQYAHRFAYEHFRGPIPAGMVIDHLCHNRWCVNPDHLEPVTMGTNLARGEHPNFIAHRTGLCQRGHRLEPGNLYYRADGRAFCRTCALAH